MNFRFLPSISKKLYSRTGRFILMLFELSVLPPAPHTYGAELGPDGLDPQLVNCRSTAGRFPSSTSQTPFSFRVWQKHDLVTDSRYSFVRVVCSIAASHSQFRLFPPSSMPQAVAPFGLPLTRQVHAAFPFLNPVSTNFYLASFSRHFTPALLRSFDS